MQGSSQSKSSQLVTWPRSQILLLLVIIMIVIIIPVDLKCRKTLGARSSRYIVEIIVIIVIAVIIMFLFI